MGLRPVLYAALIWTCLSIASQPSRAQPTCTEPHCEFTGIEKPWPKNVSASAKHEIRVGRFAFDVPQGWKYIAAAPDVGLVLRYPNMSLGLFLVLPTNSDAAPRALEESGYRLSDVPQLIFSPASQVPEEERKRQAWETAMDVKRVFYENASNPSVYRHNGMTAYSAEVEFFDVSNITLITASTQPDAYAKILAYDTPPEVIQDIIHSARIKGDN
jgi:hypothetical protein